jgi:hypothetical protein
MEELLDEERFNSGTAITRALKESARWLENCARADARRAIVILTDDENGDGRDDDGVLSGLDRAGAALSVLLAPGSERGGQILTRTPWPTRRGGIILGPRFPGPQTRAPIMDSAGVREIARETGGDTFRVDESAALEHTFARLRQRYALFYSDPTGTAPVEILLTDAVQRRYPGAHPEYRRGGRWGGEQAPVLSRAPAPVPASVPASTPERGAPGWSQERTDDDDGGEVAPRVAPPPPPPPPPAAERKGGWRQATPEDLKPAPPPLRERRKP